MKLTILTGDNIELLKQYPDNYADSVVTDCPYGLGKEPNALKLLQDWIDHGYHEITGKGFMGKQWDSFVPQPVFWKEVFRVLKPGGYVLAFFGTRTYDWGTMAIRLAGFEVRDCISWLYGSGFPKSLNIEKSIEGLILNGNSSKNDFHKQKGERKNGKVGMYATAEKHGFRKKNPRQLGSFEAKSTTPDAMSAKGLGTALKPAQELICMARKPLSGTVAENYLKYSTGGINIDGCRISETGARNNGSLPDDNGHSSNKVFGKYKATEKIEYDYGRFPANVIFDPFMAAALDEQTGILTSGKATGIRAGKSKGIYGEYTGGQEVTGFGDSGGASRFFYCAKASQEERNLGIEDIEAQKTNDGREIDADNAFQRKKKERTNFHPTVKPISLIRYLQRLVTPKGGICLDPFAGSGTSGCAAYFENIGEMVLMEMEETYIPIIEARTKYWSVERNRMNYLDEIKRQKQEVIESQMKLF